MWIRTTVIPESMRTALSGAARHGASGLGTCYFPRTLEFAGWRSRKQPANVSRWQGAPAICLQNAGARFVEPLLPRYVDRILGLPERLGESPLPKYVLSGLLVLMGQTDELRNLSLVAPLLVLALLARKHPTAMPQ